MAMQTLVTPNADQSAALEKVERWLRCPLRSTFSLGGLAGTGKSTIIPLAVELANQLGMKVKIATPTGKAASVVNAKFGKKVATTIHSLAYRPIGSRNTGKRDYLDRELEDPIFEESTFSASLLIVDEASMVSREVFNRLVSDPILILFVGDHGQLPPIGESVSPALRRLDHELTQIVRQAEDSPIRKLAYEVRQGATLCTPFPGIDLYTFDGADQIADIAKDICADLVVCATNKVRNAINLRMQVLAGVSPTPKLPFCEGEPILLLSNSHPFDVFNGEVYQVSHIREAKRHPEGPMVTCDLVSGDREVQGIELGYQWRPDRAIKDGIIAAELGYCMTAHKAQGSQANRVLAVAENLSWMNADAPRHRYTTATRASEQLSVAKFKG